MLSGINEGDTLQFFSGIDGRVYWIVARCVQVRPDQRIIGVLGVHCFDGENWSEITDERELERVVKLVTQRVGLNPSYMSSTLPPNIYPERN